MSGVHNVLTGQGPFGPLPFIFNQTISVNTANYNLRNAAVAAGWDQIKPLVATITINSGVYVYSTSTGAYSFDTGTPFPANSALALINNGTVIGMGGAGGTSGGGWPAPILALAGAAGGPALRAQYTISITNNGVISGGGGGGGGGGRGGSS